MTDTLLALFKKYKSYNTNNGTDKTTSHSYGEVYSTILNKLSSSSPTILEIGVSGGYGVQVYSEYFPSGTIYGIDIVDTVKPFIKQTPNIKLYFGDATKQETVNHFGVSYDLIIEDASHRPDHQIQHFADFCKLVKPGGYYVMEDLNEAYFNRVRDATAAIAQANGLTQTVYDLRSIKKRFDDIMLVFKKE